MNSFIQHDFDDKVTPTRPGPSKEILVIIITSTKVKKIESSRLPSRSSYLCPSFAETAKTFQKITLMKDFDPEDIPQPLHKPGNLAGLCRPLCNMRIPQPLHKPGNLAGLCRPLYHMRTTEILPQT